MKLLAGRRTTGARTSEWKHVHVVFVLYYGIFAVANDTIVDVLHAVLHGTISTYCTVHTGTVL